MAPAPWALLGALLAAPLAVRGARPADCPCITWAQDTACGNYNHFGWPKCDDYLFDPSPWVTARTRPSVLKAPIPQAPLYL